MPENVCLHLVPFHLPSQKREFVGDISTCGVKKKLSNDVYCIALKH